MVGARSSVVEQHPFKVKVGGSSPPVLTKKSSMQILGFLLYIVKKSITAAYCDRPTERHHPLQELRLIH